MVHSKIGFLLLGHGTKCSEGRQEFISLFYNICRMNPNMPITFAFLEYDTPNIDVAFQKLIQQKITKIFLLPLFLFQGVHIKNDIPKLVAKMHSTYNVEVQVMDYFGVNDELIELSTHSIEETLAKQTLATNENTTLIIAGVGSSIQQGNDEFREMAQKIIEKTGYNNSKIGFMSQVASPKVSSIFQAMQFDKGHTIVIHPILFFQGMYTKQLQKMGDIQSMEKELNIKMTATYGIRPELKFVIQEKINAVFKKFQDDYLNAIQLI